MKFFFLKLFNIYPGEERRAFLFGLLGFLWAFGVTAGLKFADALFLLHVGAHELPVAYQLTACIMILLAAVLLYVFHIFPIKKIFTIVLSLGIAFYLLMDVFFYYDIGESKAIWFALRIFGTLFFAVVITCFWTFVDHFHHLQDAKRLYGLFSSMLFTGIACTGLVMRLGLLSFQQLTVGIIALLLASIVLIQYIYRNIPLIHDEYETIGGSSLHHESSLRAVIKSVLTSRFTLLLMTANFLIYVLLVITEYNYMASFDEAFDPHGAVSSIGTEQNAQLTQFLGQWLAVISISNLIIGLFLYSRLVRHFGIGGLVFFTPVILLATFSGWTLSESLIFPVLGMFVVEGTLYVIDDSNFNLLLNAVPIKLKYKIRLIIESFFEPIGMLVSSFLLSVAWIDSKILGLTLSGCLLIVAFAMKGRYIQGIYRNLAENAIHFQRRVSDWFGLMRDKENQTAKKRLLAIIRQGDEKLLPLAIEGVVNLNDGSLVSKMLKQVDDMDSSIKLVCVEALSKSNFSQHHVTMPHMLAWMEEDSELLKGPIHFYLANIGKLSSSNIIEDLSSDNLLLKGAAILALKSSTSSFEDGKQLAETELQNLFSTKADLALRIIGPKDIKYAPRIINMLISAKDSELRILCLEALGKMHDPSLVKEIIVASVHFRPSERRKTEDIVATMGVSIVPPLLSMLKDVQLHDRCRVLASRILGRLNLALLRENVYDIINVEIDRAFFYFYYYHTIQGIYPDIDLHILEDALLTGYHSVLDFIIQLLGIAGELEDCELLSRSLRSPHPKVRGQVLETLERTSETKIFRLLRPLVSDLPDQEKLQFYRHRHNGNINLSLVQLLDHLENSSAFVDKIVSAALKYRLNVSDWRASLLKQLSTNEELFQHFAHELLET